MSATETGNRSATATADRAAAWVEGFREGWRAPRDAASFVAHFERLLDPQVRLIQPFLPTFVGIDAFRRGFAEPLFRLIPDLHSHLDVWSADGDRILIEHTLEGTLGGRPIRVPTVDRIILRGDRAIERRAYLDPLPIFAAVATRPRAWLPFLRSQGSLLRYRLRRVNR